MAASWLGFSVLVALFVACAGSKVCPQIPHPLGMQDGRIKDSQLSASSSYNKWHGPKYARLNHIKGGWCANETDPNKWIKVSFDRKHLIKFVEVQGRNNSHSGWFVKLYQVWYAYTNSRGDQGFKSFENKRFVGPKGKNAIALAKVDVETTAIMIKPLEAFPDNNFPCLRFEVYGCPANETKDYCEAANCSHLCQNEATQAKCLCPPGFELQSDGETCKDTDECTLETDRCDKNTTTCVNVEGRYSCQCLSGLHKKYVGATKCEDTDECADYRRSKCQHYCNNTYRSFECYCKPGFRLNTDMKTCTEINECKEGIDRCDNKTSTCRNTIGSYYCKCLHGLQHAQNSTKRCVDIDECKVDNGGCAHNCVNTYQSHHCTCRKGTVLNKNGFSCDDIDECDTNQHNCQQKCRNKYEGYTCVCFNGYSKNQSGICVDDDECKIADPCSHQCTNTPGSYKCSCPKGYKLFTDKHNCVDANECTDQTDDCEAGTSTCINTIGSYQCRCLEGHDKDPNTGKCKAKLCPGLTPPANGGVDPPECTKEGTKQYKDVCSFKCHQGYKLNAISSPTATCSQYGDWDFRGGYTPQCDPIRCPTLKMTGKMDVVPNECSTVGGQYNKMCQVYCTSGYKLIGYNKFLCKADGTYDGSLNNTKCIEEKKIQCPNDIKIKLPLGAKEMALPLDKLSIKIDAAKIKAEPAGVLTGTYKFKSSPLSQIVRLTGRSIGLTGTCEFFVTVVDDEAPAISNCPPENVYITLNAKQAVVSWPEPTFTDNVEIKNNFVNLKNNQMRGEQVYYVYYSAADAFNNEAVCRFFVHVKAKYCSKENMVGGDGATTFTFPTGPNGMNAIVRCDSGMFAKNMTGTTFFKCMNGDWDEVPDCVPTTPKTTDSCPEGNIIVQKQYTTEFSCAKCPKGTMEYQGKCMKCAQGTYQDQYGSTNCTKCPPNTKSLGIGQKSSSSCQAECQPGEYSKTGLYGSDGCDRCPEGSYQDLHGQKSCKVCPKGGTSAKGSRAEIDCKRPAYISRIFPESQSIKKKVGEDVTIDCYATGSPRPYMKIESVEQLPPASHRGHRQISPIPTGSKHISGMRLKITGVTEYDQTVYKCTADNKSGSNGGSDSREVTLLIEK